MSKSASLNYRDEFAKRVTALKRFLRETDIKYNESSDGRVQNTISIYGPATDFDDLIMKFFSAVNKVVESTDATYAIQLPKGTEISQSIDGFRMVMANKMNTATGIPDGDLFVRFDVSFRMRFI